MNYDTDAAANRVIAQIVERFQDARQDDWKVIYNFIRAALDECAAEVWKQGYDAGQQSVDYEYQRKLEDLRRALGPI